MKLFKKSALFSDTDLLSRAFFALYEATINAQVRKRGRKRNKK